MVKKTGRKTNCWKKVSVCSLILILFSAIVYVELPGASDYPHNASNAIGCENCHVGKPPSETSSETSNLTLYPVNVPCGNCHDGTRASAEKTHSSLNTSGTYGSWSVECVTCHNVHDQKQVSTYGSASYLYTSESTKDYAEEYMSVTSGTEHSTIISNGAGWTPQQWKGMLVIGNTASTPQVFHKINDNTADTLTVEGPLTDVVSGNTFAIVYGALIKNEINYTKTNVTPGVVISKPTKFFYNTGSNSFIYTTEIASTPPVSTQGICISCHTRTKWHKNDGLSSADHYPDRDCIACHTHEEGFKKPATGSDGSAAGPVGILANGGMQMFGADWSAGDSLKKLNASNAAYDPIAKTCSGVYCHSNGSTTDTSDTSPKQLVYKTTPQWGVPFGSNKCGSCHDNPPQYAGQGHYVSAGYMNKEGGHLVGMHFDGIYNGSLGLATTNDPVATRRSHGNSGSSTAISCNICHSGEVSDSTIDTYSMYNLSGSSAFKCSSCHNSGTVTPLQAGVIANKTSHVNGTKEVVLAEAYTIKSKAQLRDGSVPSKWTRNGGYKTAGSFDSANINSADYSSATKTCTTACHIGKPVGWGDTGMKCSSCHTSL